MAVLMGTLIGRLYYLQVIEAAKYKLLSDQNRINIRILPPQRGLILDRAGIPMADREQTYDAVLITEKASDPNQALRILQLLIGLDEITVTRVLARRQREPSYLPISIAEDLSWDTVAMIEANAPDLPGISIQVAERRLYRLGGTTAHILGYVAAPSEEEAADDPLLNLPGFRVGKAGLEKQYDTMLRGTPGTSQEEVNASGRAIRELGRHDSKPGDNLKTTIDLGLQEFTQQRLSSELSGAAVILEIASGAVLAMASVPSYSPALFDRGISASAWRELTSDLYRPLSNKVIAGQYAPGSTFKPMTALAAMTAGIGPETEVFCSGVYSLGDARFHCWKKAGHGRLNMVQAIQHSCDIYFYEVARRAGIDAIAQTARRFGLGSATGIDLPDEHAGLIPDRTWKRATLGSPWQQGETLVNAIGQGFVLATPLQLAVMAARLANGAKSVVPYFVQRAASPVTSASGEIDPLWLNVITEGMTRVTNNPRGTAYASRIDIPGMEMAGKSGTSQVRRISMLERNTGIRKNEDLPWERRDHALFIAYAPVTAPKFACAVVIEHGGGGSAVAAPIARDILVECQRGASGSEESR